LERKRSCIKGTVVYSTSRQVDAMNKKNDSSREKEGGVVGLYLAGSWKRGKKSEEAGEGTKFLWSSNGQKLEVRWKNIVLEMRK